MSVANSGSLHALARTVRTWVVLSFALTAAACAVDDTTQTVTSLVDQEAQLVDEALDAVCACATDPAIRPQFECYPDLASCKKSAGDKTATPPHLRSCVITALSQDPTATAAAFSCLIRVRQSWRDCLRQAGCDPTAIEPCIVYNKRDAKLCLTPLGPIEVDRQVCLDDDGPPPRVDGF